MFTLPKYPTNPMDIRAALKDGIAELRDAHVASHTLAAELLLLHVLGKERAWLYAHPEEPLSRAEEDAFRALLARRAAGEPLQHLTGHQEFWGLDFEVNRDVLIPRPETEHVIEVALDRLALGELRAGRTQATDGAGLCIADVGTGSGCIAVALAKELPRARIFATDISEAALAVARRNAARHGVASRIHFLAGHLLDAVKNAPSAAPQGFHLVVSNPPYIGRGEADTLQREVRDHEPRAALYGGEEGYELYGDLIAQAATRLASGGILVLELGYQSLPAVEPLLTEGNWGQVNVTNDLAGLPRVIAAVRN
jgi:release factor glutamine methyltransferase